LITGICFETVFPDVAVMSPGCHTARPHWRVMGGKK
jgi:hypothetical protein